MITTIHHDRFELVVEQTMLDTTCGIPTVDESWKFTDAAGHEHYYERFVYPTLDYVIDAQHWCNGNEGLGPHDPHMAIDESHYQCKLCGEVILPGQHPAGHVSFIAGPKTATMKGTRTDGVQVTVHITEDEYTQLDELRCTPEVAQRVLDSVPEKRWLTWKREMSF